MDYTVEAAILRHFRPSEEALALLVDLLESEALDELTRRAVRDAAVDPAVEVFAVDGLDDPYAEHGYRPVLACPPLLGDSRACPERLQVERGATIAP
jgi:HEAT repeat protein